MQTDPPDSAPDPAELTQFLNELGQGHSAAEARLMPHVYAELRKIAQAYLRGDHPGETLQPTGLVHSAYEKLFGRRAMEWNDRKHFFVIAAKAMRQVIVDHARSKARDKRGGGREAVTLDEGLVVSSELELDFIDLDEALRELEALETRQARVVELRYFAGLEVEEVAEVLEVSKTTVERDWRFARAWLAQRMGDADS